MKGGPQCMVILYINVSNSEIFVQEFLMLKDLDTINRFTVKTDKIETSGNCWNKLLVSIYDNENKIGEYERNYPSFYNTFVPFKRNNKYYTLYSKRYNETRIMSLPECKDLCGVTPGFCPVSYAVPFEEYSVIDESKTVYDSEWFKSVEHKPNFVFVSGCVWGDDVGGWKLQLINLKNLEEGIIEQIEPFGYIEMWGSAKDLSDMIDIEDYSTDYTYINIAVHTRLKLPLSQVI